jgi:hypothetical protein
MGYGSEGQGCADGVAAAALVRHAQVRKRRPNAARCAAITASR